MTLVLQKANSNESVEFAWSEKALKILLSMDARAVNATTRGTDTKLFFEVSESNFQATKSTLLKEGML